VGAPGTAIGYHPITYGPLIGEVIRRVSGKTLKQFFAEDVAGPLGADYHICAEPEHDHRVSPLFPGAPPRQLGDPQSMTYRAFFNPSLFGRSPVARRSAHPREPRWQFIGQGVTSLAVGALTLVVPEITSMALRTCSPCGW
jgi:CubicO group peptidase (beta-lactamase class C family)